MHRHFNTSLTFPSHVLNFTSENICRWALEHRERLVRWLRPRGGKSRALEQELRKGAALLIFLPFDPMAPSQPLVEEVAEIAVQYHSCNGSSWPGFMEPEVWGEPGSLSRAPCCNTLALPHWLSVSRTHNVCELCLDQALGPRHCPSLDSLYLREDSFTQPLSGKVQCSHVLSNSSPLDYYTACCWSLSKGSSTQQDRRAALPHIEDRGSASAHSAVTGLKCRTNKTLNFYLLDSGLHWEFARRLGAPENASMMGFATVLNLQDEVHHVLNQEQGIVAEIAVQYHSCNGSSWPGFMEPEVWGEPGSLSRAPCCNTLALPHWLSVSRTHNVCELCLDQALGPRHCPSLDSLYLREDSFTQPLSGKVQCSHVLSNSSPLDYYTACCWSLSKGSSTQQDRRAALPHIEDRGSASAHSTVTGLKCKTNKTLNFYLLDSGLHWEFARRLGAPENASMMGFATVLNLRDEVHHVLNQEQGIVRNTLESFIQNYSAPYSPLQRHLVGEAAREPVGESLITAVTLCLDVLLFYYTQWCGFCSALNHVIIQLARLSLSNPRLAVCRINAAKNDLPWEFMVDRYPTILFFPSDRKHLSVKYPEDAPITLPNLVRFVQRHSSPLRSSSSALHREKEPLLQKPSPPDSRADTRQGESESSATRQQGPPCE
ncbi:UNVERIFIED_CONTAM: hypothetical protein FKN15_046555 [Acipenser sinensis]